MAGVDFDELGAQSAEGIVHGLVAGKGAAAVIGQQNR